MDVMSILICGSAVKFPFPDYGLVVGPMMMHLTDRCVMRELFPI